MNARAIQDVKDIGRVSYFKIERIEHGSNSNVSEVRVFSSSRQLCPIAITVQFEGHNGEPLLATKSFVRSIAEFHPDLWGRNLEYYNYKILNEPNEYIWDEDVIKESEALYKDVETAVNKIEIDKSESGHKDALDGIIHEMSCTIAGFNGEQHLDDSVNSSALKGHKWPKSFFRQAVEHELKNRNSGESCFMQQRIIPFGAARAIIHEYERANPNAPVSVDSVLGACAVRQIKDDIEKYIQIGGDLYNQSDLRFAVKTLIADAAPSLDIDPPMLRQRVVFYVSPGGWKLGIIALLKLHNRSVHTNNDNVGDDGTGRGREEFYSKVYIIPIAPYRPDPSHPGFQLKSTSGYPGLQRLPVVGWESSIVYPYESYCEFLLGHRHIPFSELPGDLRISISHAKASSTHGACLISPFVLPPPYHWNQLYSKEYYLLHGPTFQLYSLEREATEKGGPVFHYAKGRLIFGILELAEDMRLMYRNDDGTFLEFSEFRWNTVYLYTIYGTAHEFRTEIYGNHMKFHTYTTQPTPYP